MFLLMTFSHKHFSFSFVKPFKHGTTPVVSLGERWKQKASSNSKAHVWDLENVELNGCMIKAQSHIGLTYGAYAETTAV